MRDIEIREALVQHLRTGHRDTADNRIWSEFAVCLGASRVDVCLINGHLSGFEIKSPRDNFGRLAGQVEHYSRVLDFACLVTGEKHSARAIDSVPDWWGVLSASDDQGTVRLDWTRQPQLNRHVDELSLVQLLWRDEAMSELEARDLHRGLAKATRWDIWDRLVEELTLPEISEAVRRRLKARPVRQADELLEPSGAMSQ